MKKSLELLGLLFLYGLSGMLFITFLVAYTHDNKVTILINHFGEANFELVLCSIIMLYGLILIIVKARAFLRDK